MSRSKKARAAARKAKRAASKQPEPQPVQEEPIKPDIFETIEASKQLESTLEPVEIQPEIWVEKEEPSMCVERPKNLREHLNPVIFPLNVNMEEVVYR